MYSNSINKTPVNFEQYRAVTLLFIDGVITSSSTHETPLDEESGIIKNVLSQLNRLDCVTVDSQPFEEDTVDGTLYRSRPFLLFYYPRRKINELLKFFMNDNHETLVTVYIPGKKVLMYNDNLYRELANDTGYFPLHQDYVDGGWVESFNTTFHPDLIKLSFEQLALTNKKLLEYGRKELAIVNIISTTFDNTVFSKLAHSAHALFFV